MMAGTMTTTSTTTEPTPGRSARLGFRTRVFGVLALLLVGAMLTGMVLQRAVLRARLDRDVEAAHDQELTEVQQLSTGSDPETGEPFGTDVTAIFDTFLRRNVPDDDEVYITIVGDEPYRSSRSEVRLDQDDQLVARWVALDGGDRGWAETDGGDVRWLASPLVVDGREVGTFVIATFVAEDRAEIDDTIRVEAIVSLLVLAFGLAIAWSVAGRLLRPVRDLTDNARGLDERDLTARIPVTGNDEIAELARSYNGMLDRLQAGFETQRRFVDDAGHELRTPITIIGGHLELMGDDPDDRRETVALVTDELDRMARMVDDLLVLAKAEQPRFIDPEPVDLAALTTGLVERARHMGQRSWTVDEQAGGWVLADGQRLVQATLNLLRNAVEHSETGSPIAIGTRRTGDLLQLWVRDDGEGIAPSDQDRLFERFARGATGRGRSEGAGLGLAIVRAIAEAHGGSVAVVSAPGEGATFTIEVPVEDAAPPAAPPRPNERPDGTGPTDAADDDDDTRIAPWPAS
jgi:signal transduction histidine kinase